jgi:hypothetical protein
MRRAQKRANAAARRAWHKNRARPVPACLAAHVCLQDGNLLGYAFSHTTHLLSGNPPLLPADVMRDVFGNPFRPLHLDQAWLEWNNSTVVQIAQAAYDERSLPSGTLDNVRLAILADALEDAGCTNAQILEHCRTEDPHVRGCWVVDALLAKS